MNEGPSVIGIANIFYAVGAIGAGFVAYQMSKRLPHIHGVIMFMIVFAISTVVIFLFPHSVTFIVASFFGVIQMLPLEYLEKLYVPTC